MSIKFVQRSYYDESHHPCHEVKQDNTKLHSVEIAFSRSGETNTPLATFTWKYLPQTTSMSWEKELKNEDILTVLQFIMESVKKIVSPKTGGTAIWWNPLLSNIWCTARKSLNSCYPGNAKLVAQAWIAARASPKFLSEMDDPLWCAALKRIARCGKN